MNTKSTVYLPCAITNKIKMEAAGNGEMQYSELIELRLFQAFREFGKVKDFEELKEKYNYLLKSFSPSKRGRPWNKEPSLKKRLTIYFSSQTFKNISRYVNKFNLSNSSIVELALLITDSDYNSGLPPINTEIDLKFHNTDYYLLEKLIKDTGATGVSDFLHACDYSWVIKEIKENIEESQKGKKM